MIHYLIHIMFCFFFASNLASPTTEPTFGDPTVDPTAAPTSEPTRGSIFIGESAVTSYSDAQTCCQSLGAQLVSIHDTATQEEAEALCQSVDHAAVGSVGCWIGLYDSGTNDWAWTDGSPIDYGFDDTGEASDAYPWDSANGEPNTVSEKCVELNRYQNYMWNDLNCDGYAVYPICKGTLCMCDRYRES